MTYLYQFPLCQYPNSARSKNKYKNQSPKLIRKTQSVYYRFYLLDLHQTSYLSLNIFRHSLGIKNILHASKNHGYISHLNTFSYIF